VSHPPHASPNPDADARGTRVDLIVTNAGELVTCDPALGEGPLGVIRNGALAASGGEIAWVGPQAELRANVKPASGMVEVDAKDGAVLPGLIDAHTHLVFAGDRAKEFGARMRGLPYDGGGIMSTVDATRAAGDEELKALARERLDRFLSFGVTTVEAKSGYGLTTDHEKRLLTIAASLRHPVEVVRTFLGAHVVPPDVDRAQYVKEVAEGMIPGLGDLAEFCDVWCDAGAFTLEEGRVILRAARAEGLGVKVHAEQTSRSGGATLAAEFAAVSADHLEHANEEDADALARSRTIAVLLPGATLTTGGPPAPARRLIERGVRVAVSTDFNPGTSYSENLPLALFLATTMLKMTPEEAILGATRHAAAALSRERAAGSLKPGLRADATVLMSKSYLDLIYHYGIDQVRTVVAGGRIAYPAP
jgi:imidazolonepropionase